MTPKTVPLETCYYTSRFGSAETPTLEKIELEKRYQGGVIAKSATVLENRVGFTLWRVEREGGEGEKEFYTKTTRGFVDQRR